jgi:hypothetical protein
MTKYSPFLPCILLVVFIWLELKSEMVISLSPKKYELFLRRISEDSPARFTLAKAREIDVHHCGLAQQWVIVCDNSKAAALRHAAEECCPEAVPEIEAAFKHDRFYWS